MAENKSPSAIDPVLTSRDDAALMSSPPRLAAPSFADASGKERRQPSITPRKFRRFFTPRSRVSADPSAARRALRDLTARSLNRNLNPSSSPLHFGSSPLAARDKSNRCVDEASPLPRTTKRRKTGHQTPETSPLRPASVFHDAATPEPVSHTAVASMLLSPLASSPLPALVDEPESGCDEDKFSMSDDGEPDLPFSGPSFKRTMPLSGRGFAGQLLQREYGMPSGAGNHHLPRPVADWRVETASFYSSHDDLHYCSSNDVPNGRCIPFCAAACNTNGLVAVGDEEGRVRLLDTSTENYGKESTSFGDIYISFLAHGNAVIDLAFSGDDYLLATASGDQTGKVIDMMTQTPISILDHHTASLKQVRFQPGRGEGNVLATSGRDGSVKIWDLRCRGGPAQEFTVEERAHGLQFSLPKKISQGCVVNSIFDAHARTTRPTRQMRKAMQAAVAADVTTRWEEPGRVGEVSVTAIQFLPPGKEHLLLSACEADASIKLWDIRSVHTSRQKASNPISATAPPESHSQWRPFGMSSMSLSTDGARLYGLCKDNTVYAYSTSHLVLGSAPELSSKGNDHPRRRNGIVQEGLGPLYGFRHDKFHATSFYVKTAVRPAKDGRPELLAVGSSDGCALLFPTDERYFLGNGEQCDDRGPVFGLDNSAPVPIFTSPFSRASSLPRPVAADSDTSNNGGGAAAASATTSMPGPPRRPGGLFRTNSMSSVPGRLVDTIPIVRNGTALVRGHENKEVGAVCWTHDGSLVSVGDDHAIRCWREDQEKAAALRSGGEGEGRRWASGWADMGENWEDDVDEWCEEE
ncbi:uncharacterized protein SPSK_04000 [Sporothrix schenckii 1099-18]|uniref:Uncharacterized protein n=1 Tax=Sporothrix schenckii 1099-18 TaxID=1397361 RepID=A0A0F2M284_SPOSC|nr:uncharacterized protein SPSK_04000 [Sporothrix schenckii 1099-18]KJR83817.1 hypothetical protein SPSK_04000 [Sporothrix schenckii 1099-18]